MTTARATTGSGRENVTSAAQDATAASIGPWGAGMAYAIDAWQRNVLFLDVLRQRGNQYLEHLAESAPHVLSFDAELVIDGRTLQRPVNYVLARIVPPEGVVIDHKKRPFVVVDPRAGHGPGIGGFKADSEIGVALRAGHPSYFIGFLPEPVAGQTIEDIMAAEAVFLERVIELHPEVEEKPCVIGNCQAGWAVMMLAATRPDLFGPIVIAGAPLSYWAGVHGKNPMRYAGGLLGGSWLTALLSDVGKGKFDGAWLVRNFESLNPANTLWTKQYNLWSKVDTEARRYLGFERWWGGHVNLNADEILFIVDELFIGNKLTSGEIVTRDGVRIDLRNIRSPIICFCSHGDDITPPQQALGWITDLYAKDTDIIAHGQTIVYALHESAGHLGIFVSGSIAKKEHAEFASNIDLIDVLPPGLYEAVLTPTTPEAANVEFAEGDWIVRFERRTLDDIRALGGNDLEDERRFAAARRLSEINEGLYRTLAKPVMQGFANEHTAEWLRRLNPARLPFELLSDRNPLMQPVADLAAQVREQRRPTAKDNPLAQIEKQISEQIESALDAYRDLRDSWYEQTFMAFYGSSLLQALLGLQASDAPPRRHPGNEPEEAAFVRRRIAELRKSIAEGDHTTAAIRALLYVGLGSGLSGGAIDERGFNALRQIKAERGGSMTLAEFKQIVRQQSLMLLLDEQRALAALPSMLGSDSAERDRTIKGLRRMFSMVDEHDRARQERLATVERLFGQNGEVKMPTRPGPDKEAGTRGRRTARQARGGARVAAAALRR
jgi:pimeloyl-ACP methyl ester carboxylesterase